MGFDRLIKAIDKMNNPTVAGLDPKLEYIPSYVVDAAVQQYGNTPLAAAQAVLTYNKALIDAMCDIVPAVKPQAAYYERFGFEGVRVLAETVAYAKQKGMFVIMDGKRNDIGSTMEAYADAHLGTTPLPQQGEFAAFGSDALTVNGYLGTDGIKPLLPWCKQQDAGIFVLVKTSNPSSGELQDLQMADGRTLYRHMGDLCEQWGADQRGEFGYSAVGAVVGATHPAQLTELRAALPHTFFLVPGYGAQGGGAADVAGAFDANGRGAIINSSRAILCAWKKEADCAPQDFAGAARREALRMQQAMDRVRK